jgi:hypothetical protein
VPLAVQQPLGQVVASQAHLPLVVSHSPLLHPAQAAPLVPHCELVCEAYGTHVFPLQQPLGQDVASQTH